MIEINSELNTVHAIPVVAGRVSAYMFGGPYRNFRPRHRMFGVKMAAEINADCEVDIPTVDFSVPDMIDMYNGVAKALVLMAQGQDAYVGCMGGIGRTGLFMGCMAKVLILVKGGEYLGYTDPVKLVRGFYKGHAIETDEQQAFVHAFPADQLVDEFAFLLKDPEPVVSAPEEPVPSEVPMTLWGGLINRLKAFFS